MIRIARMSATALIVACCWPLSAQAQTADPASVQQQLAAMRAQMAAMAQRIDSLEGQLAVAQHQADAASVAVAALPQPLPLTATAKPATEITWDGAPKLTAMVDPKRPQAGTWSFKPRGRLQIDIGSLTAPAALASKQTGFASELRRAYMGFEGTMPGGFGYRVEADLAASSVNLTDVYLTYKASPQLTLTLGHQKPFWGLEELTADIFTSFQERAAFSTAFGFERRVGLSAAYLGKDVLIQGGVFSDDAAALTSHTDNSYSVDGRLVFMPKLGSGQLHLGGSVHYRQFKDLQATTSYGARPFLHTTDLRLIKTPAFAADGERGLGLEAAYIQGRFHATAESHWLTTQRPGLADPTFNGGYAEVGYLLTNDTTAYKAGIYDRIRPMHPLSQGGIGAIQVNARYDWLSLNSAAIIGGRQQVAAASVLWIPTDYVRFILNYGHIWVNDAAVPAGALRRYSADAIGLRSQLDF